MSTILTFVMGLGGSFLCRLTHIYGVQMVISLTTKQDAPSSQSDGTWKKIAEKTGNVPQSKHKQ